ncbi:copper resistance CopC family protein [Cellulomonas triticagri]|nr:copper resistance CopC family protein [Cellulomonas triticagri]
MSPTEPRPDAARARREVDRRPRARAVPAPAPLTRGAAVVVALLLALAGLLLSAGRADAHNALLGTDPADGSTVEAPPAAITLTFDQPAQALGTEVVVLGPDGATVSTGDAQLVDSTVVQALGTDLPAGAYSVQWRITSADGHPLSGELAFTATAGTAPAAPVEEPEATTAPEPDPEMTTQDVEPSPITETVAPAEELAEDEDAGIAAGTVAAIVVAVLAAAAVAVFVVRERRRSSGGRGDGAGPTDAGPTDAGPDGSGDGRSAS